MTQRTKVLGGTLILIIGLIALVHYFIPRSFPERSESTSAGYAHDMAMGQRADSAQMPSFTMKEESVSRHVILPPTPQTGGVAPEVTDRMIIKTGTLSVVVKNVYEAIAEVTKITTQKGGFVVSSYVSEEGIAPTAYVTVRIPAKEFDAGVTATKQLGEVKSEHVSGQDVTAEYVDLEAQIRNLRATEQQFLTIMQRATQIQDVLAVQRELSIVRGQIEQIQGRMKYLSESAEMSTLTINLSTDAASLPVIDQKEAWKPLAVAKDALRSLLNLGKAFVNFLIWFAIYFPLWALLGLVVWGVYRWWMRKGGI